MNFVILKLKICFFCKIYPNPFCDLKLEILINDGKLNRYKVPYPTMYATEAENKNANSFNCVQVSYLLHSLLFGNSWKKWYEFVVMLVCWLQRGHQNSLEMMPTFFMLMIVGGIRHPLICASLGAVYIVSRYFYFTGYSTGDPQNRLTLGLVSRPVFVECTFSFRLNSANKLSTQKCQRRKTKTALYEVVNWVFYLLLPNALTKKH